MKKPIIFSIGHSSRTIIDFLSLLSKNGIKEIIDIRSLPGSRYAPQFNQETLVESLKEVSIRYKYIEKLGGRRRSSEDSINLGWHNVSFRGYADYMSTSEFSAGLAELIKIASFKTTAIMCAEAVPWRCHRSLISDALSKKGWEVRNIIGSESTVRHRLTPFLKMKKGQIVYPEIKN
ncbi:MAG: DUF488 domain-containing protein [Patescibacteria group bacterium]|jgi:uncharacterized protein (DUF488 family)